MNLSTIFKIKPQTLAKLILLSLIIGTSSILSPFTIRSVVDGFLVSQDRSALLFALAIIASIEAISFISDFLFRSIISDQSAEKMVLLKTNLLEKFKQKRVFHLKETFLRTWEIDIKRTVNYETKLKWLRYKDLFMLLLLSFVMINLSSQAGLFILAVSAVQFSLAAWDASRNKEDIGKLRQNEEIEHKQLNHFFQNLQRSYDTGLLHQDIDALNKSVIIASESIEQADDRRSFLLNIKTVSRGVLIIGALAIAAFGGVDMTWAAGTFWALLMIVFRLTNPIYSLAQWFYSEKSILASKERVDELLHSLSTETEGTVYYQQFKNSIGKLLLSSDIKYKKIQVIVNKDDQQNILDAVRVWTAKFLWQKAKVVNNYDFSLIENSPQQYFLFNFNNAQFKSYDLNLASILCDNYLLFTASPLPLRHFDESYIWNAEISKFTQFTGEKHNMETLKTTLMSDSISWSEAFRDIKTYSKLSISFEIIHCSAEQAVNLSQLNQNLRDVDHCIALPNNGFIFILVGSTGLGFSSLQQRFTENQLPLKVLQHCLIAPNRSNWKTLLDEAELSILNMIIENKIDSVRSVA